MIHPPVCLHAFPAFLLQGGAHAAPLHPHGARQGGIYSGELRVSRRDWLTAQSCVHNQTRCRFLYRQSGSWIVNAVAAPGGKFPRAPLWLASRLATSNSSCNRLFAYSMMQTIRCWHRSMQTFYTRTGAFLQCHGKKTSILLKNRVSLLPGECAGGDTEVFFE